VGANPDGLLTQAGERVVADAGANALLRAAADGRIERLAVFPSPPNPTAPRVGPPTDHDRGPPARTESRERFSVPQVAG
jgi:hypothetical protein